MEYDAASQPVGWSGIADPTFRSVKMAGQMVNGHADQGIRHFIRDREYASCTIINLRKRSAFESQY